MSVPFQNQLEKIGVHEQIDHLSNECLERNTLIDKKTADIIKALREIQENSSEEEQKVIYKNINENFPRLIEQVDEIKDIEENVKSFQKKLSLVDDKKSEIEEILNSGGIVDSKLTDELIQLCRDIEIENEGIASLYIECFETCQFININYEAIKVFLAKIKE